MSESSTNEATRPTHLLQCALDIRLGHTVHARLFDGVEQRDVPFGVCGPAI
jgi:hypothetical protein